MTGLGRKGSGGTLPSGPHTAPCPQGMPGKDGMDGVPGFDGEKVCTRLIACRGGVRGEFSLPRLKPYHPESPAGRGWSQWSPRREGTQWATGEYMGHPAVVPGTEPGQGRLLGSLSGALCIEAREAVRAPGPFTCSDP